MEVSFLGVAQSALISVKMRERRAVRDPYHEGPEPLETTARSGFNLVAWQRERSAEPDDAFLKGVYPGSRKWPANDRLPKQGHYFGTVVRRGEGCQGSVMAVALGRDLQKDGLRAARRRFAARGGRSAIRRRE